MHRLRVTVIDVVSMGGNRRGFGKLMNANLASLMPQVVAAWCEELGHLVRFVCYTTADDLDRRMQRYCISDLGAIVSRGARRKIAAEAKGNLALDTNEPQLPGVIRGRARADHARVNRCAERGSIRRSRADLPAADSLAELTSSARFSRRATSSESSDLS